jgi:hypothetical protein
MSKVKVLTVQFDVTGLPDEAIEELRTAVEVQGEEIVYEHQKADEAYEADLLNSSVREVDTEDV